MQDDKGEHGQPPHSRASSPGRNRFHLADRRDRIELEHTYKSVGRPGKGGPETLTALAKEADETICLDTPAALGAIGHYYRDFHQMSDAEVTDLLALGDAVNGDAADTVTRRGD
jgi:hypothetical protein